MKILNLSLSAFGPYIENFSINFEKLNHNGMFLVTGATGSGKTTILDGICFALYGKSTGGLRTFMQMRNLSAKDSQPTEVLLEFLIGKSQFKFVRRLVPYKPRGKQTFELRDEHECYTFANNAYKLIVSGSERKVTSEAERIVGLDCNQFSKVIVLPQGQFKDLLLARSTEKSKIFENLFETVKWSRVCDSIQTQVSKLKKECDELFFKRTLILKNENVNDEEELSQKLEALMQENLSSKARLLEITNQKNKYTSDLETAEKINQAKQEVLVSKKNLDDKESKLKQCQQNFQDATRYHDFAETLQEISFLENKLLCLKKVKSIESNFLSKKKIVDSITININAFKSRLFDLKQKFNKNLAASLAQNLKEGDACPVCGSCVHPNLASTRFLSDVPLESEIDILEKKIIDEEKKLLKEQNELNEISAKLNLAKETLSGNDSIEKIESLLSQKKNSYDTSIKKIELDISSAKSQLDIAKANFDNAKIIFLAAEKNLHDILSSVDQKNCMDPDTIKQKIKSLEDQYLSLHTFIGKFEEIFTHAKKSLIDIKKLNSDFKTLTKKLSNISRLSQLLSGTNASKTPIKIFVLSFMLDQILSCANVYLASFCKYRYSLSRSSRTSSRGYSGLEIEVFDSEMGGVRPVHTLSGGEIFLASISLAFGLSDVMQQYAGGVRLDSLFIDEGFDSLDQETLDVAMQSFEKIRNSGRIIGIISHISLLSDYIAEKIIINQ